MNDIGGTIERKTCGCGKPTASKGIDLKGRRRYRSSCDSCRYKSVKKRRSYCEWCFVKSKNGVVLDIDHIDGDRSNNKLSNLQTLCRTCHVRKTKIFGNVRGSKTKK
jgi:5-methylcytosine-specific restriction endonuclease McrA